MSHLEHFGMVLGSGLSTRSLGRFDRAGGGFCQFLIAACYRKPEYLGIAQEDRHSPRSSGVVD